MLVELVIENYAVIERLRVRFHRGLNLLTGETGSGKSIVVDALGLLFGGRASPEMIRTGAERARISGIFEAPAAQAARALLESAGIETEDGELLIEREILAGGKSRAFAGSRPVTAALLRDLAQHLGDIHGQHDQQRLFEPDAQLEILDAFAGAAGLAARGRRRLTGNGAPAARNWMNWSATSRRSCGWRTCGASSAARSKRRRPSRARTRSSKPSGAACRTSRALRRPPAAPTRRSTIRPSPPLARIRAAVRRLEELARIDPALAALAESLKPAEFAVEEVFLRAARLPVASGSQSRAARGDRVAPGRCSTS